MSALRLFYEWERIFGETLLMIAYREREQTLIRTHVEKCVNCQFDVHWKELCDEAIRLQVELMTKNNQNKD